MNNQLTTPHQDGYYMPAEWTAHKQIWMIWPERNDNWRLGAKPAQKAFANVADAISKYTPVSICVSHNQYQNAKLNFNHNTNIRIIEMSNNDAWMRDTGPTFIINNNQIRGVDWSFNAWGGLNEGLYFPWDLDDQIAEKILQIEDIDRYRTDNFILEGGSIHVDGEGTLLTTEECLLNPNRNPDLDRKQIEQYLKDYLGITKVIWLPYGLYNDETDGHVDNFCCFARPGEVILAWTDDKNDPNYERCHLAYDVLNSQKDAKNRKLKIHKMNIPGPIFATKEECISVDFSQKSQPRDPAIRLAGSYVNFLITNKAIIAPYFDDPSDNEARQRLKTIFPTYDVVMVPGREILLGGGNIHCITQQQPKI